MKFKDNIGAEDSANYLKIKDKESVVGVFAGEVYEFAQHWPQGGQKTICSGDSQCTGCHMKIPASFRFKVNFVTSENGVMVAKVWEQGAKVYKQLRDLNKDYDLEHHFFKVTRSGSGAKDTTYTVLPLKNGELNAEQKKKVLAVNLNNLFRQDEAAQPYAGQADARIPAGFGEALAQMEPPFQESDIPF